MPSATGLIVGFLFSAVMTMLCGPPNEAAATAVAGRVAEPCTTLVRSEAVFAGRWEADPATGDRSSSAGAASCCFAACEAPEDAGALTVVRVSAYSTLYR